MSKLSIFSAVAIIFVVASSPARIAAQCTYDWRPGEGVPGISGGVTPITTWDPDGVGPEPELLVVANVELAGSLRVNGVAAWDGAAWHALGAHASGSALTVYNGRLIAGTDHYGFEGIDLVSQWDGSRWQPMGSALRGAKVFAFAVFNGELIAAGSFRFQADSSNRQIKALHDGTGRNGCPWAAAWMVPFTR